MSQCSRNFQADWGAQEGIRVSRAQQRDQTVEHLGRGCIRGSNLLPQKPFSLLPHAFLQRYSSWYFNFPFAVLTIKMQQLLLFHSFPCKCMCVMVGAATVIVLFAQFGLTNLSAADRPSAQYFPYGRAAQQAPVIPLLINDNTKPPSCGSALATKDSKWKWHPPSSCRLTRQHVISARRQSCTPHPPTERTSAVVL